MADCSGFIGPLNLQCLLVNTFSGTMEIFIFLSVIVIASLAARFRMQNQIALTMLGLYIVIMSLYVGSSIYALVIFVTALVSFWGVTRFFKA